MYTYNGHILNWTGNWLMKPPSIPTDGLLAFYKLNGDAVDATGNGYNGTVYGATYDSVGKINGCYYFDGVAGNNYIDITSLTEKTFPPNKFSVSLWAKADHFNFSHSGVLFQSRPNSGEFTNITVADEGKAVAWIYPYTDKVGMPVDANTWFHLVFMYDGSNVYLYINNVLANESGTGGAGGSNRYCGLGNSERLYDEPFYGLIDHVRIYNRALIETEVQKLYDEGN